MIHYLGPRVGHIPLRTWEELALAAQGGMLKETQWVELKQQLGPSKNETNIELARDLASLSVTGGVLIVGLEDKTFEAVGCDISGMADRISQVASMRVHPPLSPVIYPAIQHPADESRHVLVVEVPVSPLAPHMVDGSYWGRSSTGKRKLSDAEVRRLMQARTSSQTAFKERLLAMVHQDPLASAIEGHPTGNGHIYLLAQPCAPALGRRDDFSLMKVIRETFRPSNTNGTPECLRVDRRDPKGQVMASPEVGEKPIPREREDAAAFLLCADEDGSLEFVSGGGSIYRLCGEKPVEKVGSTIIARSTLQFFELIMSLALKAWGYTGPWHVGIHVTNLQGKPVDPFDMMHSGAVFPRDSFTNTVVTNPISWPEGAEPEARELLRGFLRAVYRENATLDQV